MRKLNWRAIGAACLCHLLSAHTAQADMDSDWARRAFTEQSAEPAEQSRTTKRRGKVSISGLARADLSDETPARKSSGGGCIPAQLQGVLTDVEAKFGNVKVTSTCRSASANRAAGGAPQSLHLYGQAVDFRVSGNTGAVMSYLTAHGSVGGLKHYGGGLYHIDTGDRRRF